MFSGGGGMTEQKRQLDMDMDMGPVSEASGVR